MLQVLEPVVKRKLPFVVTFGNHDNEQGMTREQLYDIIRKVPGNLLPDRGTVLSPDYVLTVKSSSNVKKDAALLYCMDSHSYSPLKDVKGYAWLTFDQINWYRQQSAAYKAQMVDSLCRLLPFSIFLFLNTMKLPVPKTRFFAELVWRKLVHLN